jgi:hypothetical protein
MKRLLLILLVIFLLVAYFILRWRESGIPRDATHLNPATAALTVVGLRNAAYRTADCGRITLRNGEYARADRNPEARCSISLLDKVAFGDLNGDGAPDAAVFLGTDLGGSGFFVSLAAVLNRSGAPEHVASIALEDRIKIDDVKVEGGIIQVGAVIHSSAAPMCCPDSSVTWRFRLAQDSLVRLSER